MQLNTAESSTAGGIVREALALKQRMQQKIQSYDPAAPNQLSETLA